MNDNIQPYKKGTKEERKIIIDCYEKIEDEFYTVLGLHGCEFEPTQNDIKKACENAIKATIDFNDSEFSLLIVEYFKEVFEILSNPRLKQVYDREFYSEILDFNDNKTKVIVNSAILNLIIQSSSYPFEDISILIGSKHGVIKPWLFLNDYFFKNKNGLFKFLKSFYISFIPMPLISLSTVLINEGFNLFFNSLPVITTVVGSKENRNYTQKIFENILNKFYNYPISFILRTILIVSRSTTSSSLSRSSMSIFQIIKNVILRKQSTVGIKSLEWKNLFYAVGPVITIQLTKDFIEWLICKYFQNQLIDCNKHSKQLQQKQKQKQQQSQLFNIISNPYCNSFLRVILITLLTYPLSVIEYQYYGEFVQSYINGSTQSIPIVLNPISMAIKISKQQTFKKFYNGVLFKGVYHFLDTLSFHFIDRKIYFVY